MPTSIPQRQRRLFQSLGQPPLIFSTTSHHSSDASSHAAIVTKALKAGFTAVDASNDDRFHYREKSVGNGIREGLKSQELKREQIFVQTTCLWPPLPEDDDPLTIEKTIEEHVHSSIQVSLQNLRHEENEKLSYIDLVLMDAPAAAYSTLPPKILDAYVLAAWRALSSHVPTRIRYLGVRNFSNLKRLSELHRNASIKPAITARTFAPAVQWDLPIRTFCARYGVIYTAAGVSAGVNKGLMRSTPVALLAQFAGVDAASVLTALLIAMGMPVLLGEDLGIDCVAKRRDEVKIVQAWAAEKKDSWTTLFDDFVHLIRT